MSNNQPTKLLISLDNLERALQRLDEALKEPSNNSLLIDGTIQRFEFAIELLWKTLRRALLVEGIEINTPREALIESYRIHWLEEESIWLSMLKDKNETSHLYNEVKAQEIYNRIHDYYDEMIKVLRLLIERYR